MRRIAGGAGVSEVVGALMLVLIVVAAATSFAIFIADKQEALQHDQRIQARNENEKMGIMSVGFSPDANSTRWWEISVKVSNLHSEVSYVSMITINDHVVKKFEIRKNGISMETDTDYLSWGRINSTEQVEFVVHLDLDFYGSPITMPLSSFLHIKISTNYGNTFFKNFIPPSAIGKIKTEVYWNPSIPGYSSMYILDGTLSEANTKDSEIVSWDWEIEGATNTSYSGKMVVATLNPGPNIMNLTVTDQWGMKGTTSFSFIAK